MSEFIIILKMHTHLLGDILKSLWWLDGIITAFSTAAAYERISN